jgi:peptidoglycan/xylan/chitin deacetylase (PgdA/CDA1 family)
MISYALRFFARDRLSVFLFHKVPAARDPLTPQDLSLEEFSRLIDFIAEYFQVIPLDDAVQALSQNRLPPRAACITFDDGYPDWTQRVLPVLEAKNIPATFYITTCQFGGAPMWHERIANAVRTANMEQIALDEFGLPPMSIPDDKAKAQVIAKIEHHLKYQTVSCRDEAIACLESLTGASVKQLTPMPAEDVRAIHSKGFTIGAHTVEHPILSLCSRQEAVNEIGAVKESLEHMIGGKVNSFAYPNGNPLTDFSAAHIGMVKAAGYAHAVTTQWGAARSGDSTFQIPRFTPWGPSPLRMQLQMLRNLLLQPASLEEA